MVSLVCLEIRILAIAKLIYAHIKSYMPILLHGQLVLRVQFNLPLVNCAIKYTQCHIRRKFFFFPTSASFLSFGPSDSVGDMLWLFKSDIISLFMLNCPEILKYFQFSDFAITDFWALVDLQWLELLKSYWGIHALWCFDSSVEQGLVF